MRQEEAERKKQLSVEPPVIRNYQKRVEICRACPEYISQPVERCGRCGCRLMIKARAPWAKCPLNYWKAGIE